jgi:hypothetical protein
MFSALFVSEDAAAIGLEILVDEFDGLHQANIGRIFRELFALKEEHDGNS